MQCGSFWLCILNSSRRPSSLLGPWERHRLPLKGPFTWDVDIGTDIDVDMDIHYSDMVVSINWGSFKKGSGLL